MTEPAPTTNDLFAEYAKSFSETKELRTKLEEIGPGLQSLGEHLRSGAPGLPTVEGDMVLLKIPGEPAPKWEVNVEAVQRVADLITEYRRLLDRQRALKRDLEETPEGRTLLKSIR